MNKLFPYAIKIANLISPLLAIKMKSFVKRQEFSLPYEHLFDNVCIEITTKCNYKCSFCAQSFASREENFMTEDVFRTIIDQLAEKNYSGGIGFQVINEPLCHDKLESFINYASKKCPESKLHIISNGALLKKDRLLKLFENGLSNAYINDYSKGHKVIKRLSPIIESLEPELQNKIELHKRSNDEVLSSHGGNANGAGKFKLPLNAFCSFPFERLVINSYGDIIICCSDYLSDVKFGNVMHDNVVDKWYGNKFNHIRKLLYHGKRDKINICKKCDEIHEFF
ncbi:SPASM domain-containing protein [candidate division KSB1 bacterium]|nr:SPASM domain-containing protein [candidate division KSB1 bacterium]